MHITFVFLTLILIFCLFVDIVCVKDKNEEPGVEAELNFEFFEFYQNVTSSK